MNKKTIYASEPVFVGDRKIYFILSLSVKKSFFYLDVDYEVVAIKIIEKEEIYYKNISLSEKKFEKLKNNI